MNLESFVAKMMRMNDLGRLWHWGTSSAQHHVTYEKFLTENEALTDSFVESILGNDLSLQIDQIKIEASLSSKYDISNARDEIKSYRSAVRELQDVFANENKGHHNELNAILDGVNELCSKTLYLLNLK